MKTTPRLSQSGKFPAKFHFPAELLALRFHLGIFSEVVNFSGFVPFRALGLVGVYIKLHYVLPFTHTVNPFTFVRERLSDSQKNIGIYFKNLSSLDRTLWRRAI